MRCVLVVEDNEDLRSLYQAALAVEGIKAVVAAHGREALDMLEADVVRPDVILLDLMMPVLNGWDFLLLRAKDERLARIPVIVCSATRDNIPKDVPFLKKPIDLEELFSAIACTAS